MNGEETAEPRGNEASDANPQARIVVRDDLRRSRLTVFFRLFLALPHLIVLGVWSLIALLMAIINWFAILFSGRTVGGDLPVRYLRYFTHVDAYLNLAANPFPGFGGDADSYPIEVEVSEARRQSRWKTAFRLVLAFPALLLGFRLRRGGRCRPGAAISGPPSASSPPPPSSAGSPRWPVPRMPQGLRDPDRLRARILGAGGRVLPAGHRPISGQRPARTPIRHSRRPTIRSASPRTMTCGARASPSSSGSCSGCHTWCG